MAILIASCSGGGPIAVKSPTPVTGGLAQGLIGYLGDQGVGVVDPVTGKSTILAPFPPGAPFRTAGPVWAPAPGLTYPVLYFTLHDLRPVERLRTPGVVPYDWLFRVDPFTGAIDPIAASMDATSEGPIGLVANQHYVALTVGCCSSYEVDALDVTKPLGPLRVLSKPPEQSAFFTEGAAPGQSGLIAVRAFGTGAWYWLNADAGVLNPFPLKLGTDDGPIAISKDGTLAAVSLPDHGATIMPINTAVPEASASPNASPSGSPAVVVSPRASPTASQAPPRKPAPINSKLPHVDGLSWSPDGKQIALAVNGQLDVYATSAADGAPAAKKYGGTGIIGTDWSEPIAGKTGEMVKPGPGPQATIDALLTATTLPAAADNATARPQTKVYLWQFDSSKPSPLATIADPTPAVLTQYPPLPAAVVIHHWAPSVNWQLLGGCFRYRVVIAGSISPVASTLGLGSSTLCNAPPSPSPSGSPKTTASP
jgi:hypothetical protein